MKYRFCFWCCLFFLATDIVNGQVDKNPVYTDVTSFKDSILLAHCPVFIDKEGNQTNHTVLQQAFIPLSEAGLKPRIPAPLIPKTFYLKLLLSNSADTNNLVYLLTANLVRDFHIYAIDSSGQLHELKDESGSDGYQPLLIKARSRQAYLIKMRFARYAFTYLIPQLIRSSYREEYIQERVRRYPPGETAGYVFSGMLLMMFVYSFVNFILSRRMEFAWNGAYVACMFVLIFFNIFFEKKGGYVVSFFFSYMAFAMLACGTVFYIAFTRRFLDTEKNLPLLNRILLYEEKGILLVLALYSLVHFSNGNFAFQQLLENIIKITALVVGVFYLVIAFMQKNKLMNYLAWGNAMLIIFSLISFVLLQYKQRSSLLTNSLFYLEIGIVCELLFFMLGLAYKNRIELIEKTREQEALKRESEKQSYEAKLAILDARQKERNRISADMHDELGAGITAIRLYSELARNKPDDKVKPEIEKISQSANELLNSMNTIIWAMSNSNDTLENMVAYIRSYAQEYLDNTGIRCRFSIMEEIPALEVSGAMRKNIFMVVKECLNNIVKHSKASEVNIIFNKEDANNLSLVIHDNGTGFDLDKTRRFGNGLKNMQKRMEEMNIRFSIENDNGTKVKLHYTIPPALQH